MDEKDLSYKLRAILHRHNRHKSVDKIVLEFKHVVELYGYDVDVHILDTKHAMYVDVFPYVQYLKNKFNNKIYEVIPQGSPLKKYTDDRSWKQKKACVK
jgi:hypothetical protein